MWRTAPFVSVMLRMQSTSYERPIYVKPVATDDPSKAYYIKISSYHFAYHHLQWLVGLFNVFMQRKVYCILYNLRFTECVTKCFDLRTNSTYEKTSE